MDSDDDFAPSKGRMRLSNLFGRGKTEDTTADDFQFRPTQKRSNKPNRKDADTSAVDSHIVDVVEQNHQSRNTNSTNVVLSTVQVFRNQQIVAPKAVCLLVVKTFPSPEALQGFLYCYDHQKKGIFQVKLSKQFVFFQRRDEAAEQYCSVYDPAIQEHWTLRFKSEDDAERFAINASLLKYCLELFSNDSLPDSHVVTCTQPIRGSEQHVCGNGMKIMLSYRIWSLETVDTVFKLGSIIDENSLDRDGGYTFHFSGDTRALMPGWVYALQGSRKGTSKLVFLLTSDQIGDGFGNVSSTTPCAVYFMVHSVESNIKISTVPQPKASQIAEQPNLLDSLPPNSKAASVEVPPPNDSQQLVLNTLLSMLQQPAQRSPITSSVSFDMERALDRLSLQISSLYEKIDRQNVERYLETNNAKLELMIRKTLGKAPSGDLGVDLSAESNMDKDQLLAQIENQRNRIQTLTESYHNALEQIGKEKEAVRSLQADLGIERESTLQRIHDISERKRLEAIEMEMRLREGIENELRMKCDEAFSKGYTDGLETGRKEATEGIGTHAASSQALKALELEKEKALVQLRTELNEKERIILQDRKASDERLHAMQVLLQRFEEKEKLDLQTQKQLISAEDAQALLSRHLKKIMNNLYYSIEEHFNSLGKDTLTSTEALGVVTKTIKSETKNALGWLKEEISTQVKKVPSQSDVPLPLDHTPQMASPSAQPARDTVAEESTQPTEVFKQIPTALGLSLAERIQAISESRTEINEEEWM